MAPEPIRHASFVLRHPSSVIRHPSFVIRHSVARSRHLRISRLLPPARHAPIPTMMPVRRLLLLFPILLFNARSAAAEAPASPWESSAITLESGLLWEVGHNTPLAYRLVPTQLSWRSPRAFGRTFTDGSRLLVRHRLTLLGTWVQQGPESHYIAVTGSPSVEWWGKEGKWCLFGGSGGGFGWLDSQGVKGAQGQDFTLNWFARAGIEHVTPGRGCLSAGVMFQHMSNGGQTNPNPGIDAVGFTVGYAWSF